MSDMCPRCTGRGIFEPVVEAMLGTFFVQQPGRNFASSTRAAAAADRKIDAQHNTEVEHGNGLVRGHSLSPPGDR